MLTLDRWGALQGHQCVDATAIPAQLRGNPPSPLVIDQYSRVGINGSDASFILRIHAGLPGNVVRITLLFPGREAQCTNFAEAPREKHMHRLMCDGA